MATSRPWLKADPAGRTAGTLADYRAGREEPSVVRASAAPSEQGSRERRGGGTFAAPALKSRDKEDEKPNVALAYQNPGTRSTINAGVKKPDGSFTTLQQRDQQRYDDKVEVARTGEKPDKNIRLSGIGRLQTRQLTPEEWAAMSPEQQQGIVANYAAYQAGQADKAAGTTENSKAAIEELGLKGVSAQDLVSGRAITTANDLDADRNNNRAGVGARTEVFGQLSASSVFDNESLRAALAAGQGLLDGLRSSMPGSTIGAAVGQSAVSKLDDAAREELDNVLEGLASRNVWARIQAEPELNQRLQADLADVVQKYGQDQVTQYFDESYKGFAGDDGFMSYDEFMANWLEKR